MEELQPTFERYHVGPRHKGLGVKKQGLIEKRRDGLCSEVP